MNLATIDLTVVTDKVAELGAAIITASGPIITAALGVAAVFYGGRALWRFFKGLAK